MSNLIAKQFEDYNIRMFTINNEVYFVGKDIAVALEYQDPKQAIRVNCKNQQSVHNVMEVTGYTSNEINGLGDLDPKTNLITKRDVFRLVMRSNKPEAEKFQDWVYDVIDEISKTGSYSLTNSTPNELAEIINDNNRKIIDFITNFVNESNTKVFDYIDNSFDTKINKLIAYKNIGDRRFSFQEVVDFLNKEYAPPGKPTDISKLKSFLISVGMIKGNSTPFKKFIDNGCIIEIVDPFSSAQNNIVFTKAGIAYIVQQLVDQGYITI